MPETLRRVFALILRCIPLAFYSGLVVTTVVCLMPSTSVPPAFQFWDKAQHSLGFAMLGVTGAFTFPNRLRGLCIGLVLYGVATEVMQSTFITTRNGDVMDCLADAIGVFMGVAVYTALAKTRSLTQPSA